ncbi:hypothetical protein PM082_011056 [Marasmius tenuissimus]|nr:hypothetical protein PM082_011056 [Marasmius tenuissimus]
MFEVLQPTDMKIVAEELEGRQDVEMAHDRADDVYCFLRHFVKRRRGSSFPSLSSTLHHSTEYILDQLPAPRFTFTAPNAPSLARPSAGKRSIHQSDFPLEMSCSAQAHSRSQPLVPPDRFLHHINLSSCRREDNLTTAVFRLEPKQIVSPYRRCRSLYTSPTPAAHKSRCREDGIRDGGDIGPG